MNRVLIDSNFLCHQAFYAMGNLTGSVEKGSIPSGIVFGFLHRILTLGEYLRSNRMVFCWDSVESVRREQFPDYKQHRRDKEQTDEEREAWRTAYKQFNALKKDVLHRIGFRNSWCCAGFESDDLMAKCVLEYPQFDFVIVTADQDLYQCVAKNCQCYNPTSKKWMGPKEFFYEYGIRPNQWAYVKAFGGCKSDNVPGIAGIGEGRALSYLKKTLKGSYAAKIEQEGPSALTAYLPLVELPHTRLPWNFKIWKNNFDLEGLMGIAEEYDLNSFASPEMKERWKAFFNMGK